MANAFTVWDWLVIAAYMAFTTWLGHRLSGKQTTIKDFFLGGKSLPWWAVSGSMIATEISALTFIGVPGMVFAAKGDWTYLQWGIGSIIARFAVGYFLVPLYYEKEIYSPYDFMGNRLGETIKRLVTGLFSLGAILGQSVRVLVTAIILEVVLPLDRLAEINQYAPIAFCIAIIGFVAIIWTFIGGMQAVIWTDVIQFAIFVVGGFLALSWMVCTIGWEDIMSINKNHIVEGSIEDKTTFLDFTLPWDDPMLKFTFWVGIIAMPFQNLAAFGTDQLNTQRMFCCRNALDARKAMCWSSLSQVLTLLMLCVGSGLFAWYVKHPPNETVAKLFEKSNDNVFAIWIVSVLPVGLSGLVLAGAFAAAISSLDSILAALSQTTLSVWYGKERLEREGQSKKIVSTSRILVVCWGIFLTSFAILLGIYYKNMPPDERNLISLAFGMISYTYGPLLGILCLSIFVKKASTKGILIGVALSILLVFWTRPELPAIASAIGFSEDTIMKLKDGQPKIVFPWFYIINTALTFFCGWVGGAFFTKVKEQQK